MAKSTRKSLILIFLSTLIISLLLMSLSLSIAKSDAYAGLTGKSGGEITEKVTLESFSLDQVIIKTTAPCGIKFVAKVSEIDLQKLPSDAKFGTVILPKSMLGDAELTIDTQSSKIAWANNYSHKDGVYSFSCVLVSKNSKTGELVNLEEKFFGMEFCARAFVTYHYSGDDGGEMDVAYTQAVSKFPREVANSILSDGELNLNEKEKQTLKTFAQVKDKIGYFDEEFGVYQVSEYSENGDNVEIAYSTDFKFGDQAGALKINCLNQLGGRGQAFIMDNLIEKNLSGYGYVEFSIYATHAAQFKFYNLTNDVFPLIAGEWTCIRVGTSQIESAATESGAYDITGLIFCLDGAPANSAYYISAMFANVEHKIVAFDQEYGLKQITKDDRGNIERTLSYSTDMRFGEQDGALKVVRSGGNWGNGQTFVLNSFITIKDLSYYDYVEFYVWTDTADTGVKFLNVGHTNLKANQWTHVKVSVTDLVGAYYVTKDAQETTVTNLTGLTFCFYDVPSDGSAVTFYVSAMYARTNI